MQARDTMRVTLPILLAALSVAGAPPSAAQVGGRGDRVVVPANRVVVPAETVVRVRLDDRLSSRTATVGDRFTATIDPDDRSGFPIGTRFEGAVTDVQKASADQPGTIGMRFRRVVLPDGR